MQATHDIQERAGSTVDVLRAHDMELSISRTGAELFSIVQLSPGGGRAGYLHRDGVLEAPAAGWANHATVMGYYIHRLWQETSSYEGTTIRGGNHGFLRHFAFAAPEFDPASGALAYHVPAHKVPCTFYPLRVSCTISYKISAPGTLEVSFRFVNEEPARDACLSFGLHPGFAITNQKSADFFMPPGRYRRLIAPGNFLNGEIETIDHEGGPMPFRKEGLPDSYLLDLSEVPNRIFELCDAASGRTIRFDLAECPYLTLWSDAQDFLCVEPCWGMPDANPPVPFEQKTGIETIPCGGTLQKGFSLHFHAVTPQTAH